MKKGPIIAAAFAALLTVACQQSADPHDIHDADTCIICNMGINNHQAATQIVKADGSAVKFDDIGCMVQYMIENDVVLDDHTAYANSYDTQEWFDAESGTYIYSSDIPTPMGNGVINFASAESAETYIEDHSNGEILDFDDLMTHDWNSF